MSSNTTIKWKVAQWFELRWWKNYLRGKDKATYLQWKRNYWQNLLGQIADIVKIENQHTICDLGCGPAGIFIALPHNQVTAVDPLLNEYEKQLPFFDKSEYPNVTFVTSTIEDFGNSKTSEVLKTSEVYTYDVVFCLNAINHVYDIQAGFAKLRELCATNGQVIVSIDAHNYSLFKYLFHAIPGDVLHPHQYNLGEYKTMLEEQGLAIQKTVLLKQEFIFNHYLLVAKTESK
ncbi:MAG TPA: class I SAM-dependent methyltransferase [Chitinophagales bacterium]|nr:class I SAM-dependent methyltransferase [Chitinophagales bacterium]